MRLLSVSNPKTFSFLLLLAPLIIGLQGNTSFGKIGQKSSQPTPIVLPASATLDFDHLIPSPLSHWKETDAAERRLESIAEAESQPIVVLDVRVLTFVADEQPALSGYFKPGSFEVITGSSPTQQPTVTNQGELPVRSHNVAPDQSPTKIAASIRSTQISKPVALAKIGEQGLLKLIEQIESQQGVELTKMPTGNILSGRAVATSDVSLRPFVVGVKDRGQGGKPAMEPIVQLIEDGLTFRARPSVENGEIELLADVALTQVTGVKDFAFPQFAKKNPDSGVHIQIPEVTRDSVHLDSTLENNETLFVDAMLTRNVQINTKASRFKKAKIEKVEKRIFLLITARVVEQQAVVAQTSIR